MTAALVAARRSRLRTAPVRDDTRAMRRTCGGILLAAWVSACSADEAPAEPGPESEGNELPQGVDPPHSPFFDLMIDDD